MRIAGNLNQSLLSELNTGIVILDTSLRVKFINSSALTILDTTEKTSIGQKIDQLFFDQKPQHYVSLYLFVHNT